MATAHKLPTVSTLIKESIAFYKKHHKLLIQIGLVIVGIQVIQQLVNFAVTPGQEMEVKVAVTIIVVVLSVAAGVFQVLMQISLIRAIKNCEEGKTCTVGQLYSESTKLFWSFVLVSIIAFFVTVGSALFFIIPIVLLSGYFMFTVYALTLDNKKGFAALSTSFYYIEGYWWPVVWRGIALSLIIGLIAFVIGFALVGVLSLSGVTFSVISDLFEKGNSPAFVVSWTIVVGFISLCVAAPITTHYTYSIYKHLKAMKPEPNLGDAENKTRKNWFVGLMIIGIVLLIAFIALGVTFAAKNAEKLGDIRHRVQAISKEVDTHFVVKDPSRLVDTPYTNEKMGFSILYPKTWAPEVLDGEVLFKDPTQKKGEVTSVLEVQYFDKELITSDAVAYGVAEGIKKSSPELAQTSFSKVYIGPRLAYLLSGKFIEETNREMRYYLVTNESGAYVITASWRETESPAIISSILDSIASFTSIK